jgi:hypothetical protein
MGDFGMITKDEAIYLLYKNVTSIVQSEDCFDITGNPVTVDWDLVNAKYNELLEQEKIKFCKEQASALLYETDWTTIADVSNPANTPYLTNQSEFIAWRNQIRALAVNPVVNPVFPPTPEAIWG